ncbi:uncharacterized protein LOC130441792 [Diorhabda sublineata]|uniref:uncharacterized protein LOC130441792 n=1 Tax=Diorhabda sublineata TaxID=1163346 RepID=UPI0024E0ED95|nr:uncharacterized protein LOC130441792 [Diorhabda sublineata]
MGEEIITEEQCERILARYLLDENAVSEIQDSKIKENTNITSFSSRLIDNQCEGLIGEQFFLTIKYHYKLESKLASFFVKILSKSNGIMYRIAKEIRAFENESFFYGKYIPYLQDEGFPCTYVPKSYFFESEIIVLEDLVGSSYKSLGKNVSLDINHCYKCLETIARFHADSMLFELKKSKDLAWEYKLSEAFPEVFEHHIEEEQNVLVAKYYEYGIRGLKKLIELLPEDTIEVEQFVKLFEETIHKIPEIQAEGNKKYKTVLTHNDLWCSNILYKYANDKNVESCKLIDFQTITLKPPIVDVLGFIYLNTRKTFRDIHTVDLISQYYTYLSKNIEAAGYNVQEVISFGEFQKSFEFLRLTCKIHCIIDRSFTLIPDDLYVENSRSEATFSNFIFEGRPDMMAKLFRRNDVYKEIMTEELFELKTLLFVENS